MIYEPLGNRVLVRKLQDITTTAGGIKLPDGVVNKQTFQAEVLAVGPGARDFHGTLWPVSVRVGDKVVFLKAAGTNVGMDHEKLVIVTEDDLLGKVHDGQSL